MEGKKMGGTPLEILERWQRVLRVALERMEALRLSSDLDESFYDALRECMLAAGATDADLDALAAYHVNLVVERTAAESEERLEQLEVISAHLSCTDMRVRIGKGDSFVYVEFPSRQRTH